MRLSAIERNWPEAIGASDGLAMSVGRSCQVERRPFLDEAVDRLAAVIRKIVVPSSPAATVPERAVDSKHLEPGPIESIRADRSSAEAVKRRDPVTRATSARKSGPKGRPPLPAAAWSRLRRSLLMLST